MIRSKGSNCYIMCMPVGHVLAGTAWFLALRQPDTSTEIAAESGFKRQGFLLSWGFFVFFSNLPDVDFLPFALSGNPNYYTFHHGWTHSIGAAVIVSLFYGYIAPNKVRVYCTVRDVFLLFMTHLLLDIFTYDFTPPYGIQLLWPLWNGFVYSDISFFCFIFKWWPSTIELHQLIAMPTLISYVWEIVFFGTIIFWIRMRSIRKAGAQLRKV